MIISKIIGGLGNQMFQYAIGRSLSIKNNTELKLDIKWYSEMNGCTPRKYNLDIFKLKKVIASEKDIEIFLNSKNNFLNKIKKRLPFFNQISYRFIPEKYFHFDQDIIILKNNSYLSGYWQSEKYFHDIRNVLLEDFTITNNVLDKNLKYIDMINKSNSISLHVRRGDYITNPNANKHHYVCPVSYYKDAVKILSLKKRDIILFVFSDDIEWVKENLKFDVKTYYIDNDDEHNYEDLRIMSLCKDNIIANSSFSWWGAWLNRNSYKNVIAPKIWFNDPKINTYDLYPEKWLKI